MLFELSKKTFFLISILVICITLFLRVDLAFSYLHDTGYGGFMLYCIYGIQTMIQNGVLYLNPEESNYAVIQYSPLFYYISTGLAFVFQIKATEVYKIMVMTRIFCLLCNILGAYFFSLWLKDYFKVHKSVFWIGGGLSLIFLTSHFYTRVDSLFLLLWVVSMYCFFRYIDKPRSIWLWVLAALCTLNFFAKQNALSSVGFFTIALFFLKDWKTTLSFIVKMSIFGILYLALLLINEDSTFLYMNVFKGIKNGVSLEFLPVIKKNTLFWSSILFFGFYTFKKFKQSGLINSPIIWAVIFFIIETAFSLFKIGSSANYLVPVELLILGLLIGSIWSRQPSFKSEKIYYIWILIVVVLFAFYENTVLLYDDLNYKKLAQENYQSQKELAGYLENQLTSEPSKKVLFLDQHNYLNNFLLKQAVFPTLSVTYQCYASDPSLFSYRKFEEQLSHGEIGYIVAHSDPRPSFVFLGYELKQFAELKSMGRYTIYKFQNQ